MTYKIIFPLLLLIPIPIVCWWMIFWEPPKRKRK